MANLHYWDAFWDLRLAECPCDQHFCEWLEAGAKSGKSIFHFGTGGHHLVGVRTAEVGADNAVLGITASPQEYDTFVKLAIDRPEVERTYKVFFGDIYQLDARLLPDFDIVTLFHLCEFRSARNDEYGALTDREVLDLLAAKVRPGGTILFYTKSFAFDNARTIIDDWLPGSGFKAVAPYETLVAYRRG